MLPTNWLEELERLRNEQRPGNVPFQQPMLRLPLPSDGWEPLEKDTGRDTDMDDDQRDRGVTIIDM